MDRQYGLVFKDENDDVWLGIYENSTIRVFGSLSDFDGSYDDLELSKFSFVEIEEDANDRIWIKDLHRFEMCQRPNINESLEDQNDPDVINISQFLTEIHFPSEESDDVFSTFLNTSGKTN